jgi:hypothetical protein
MCHATVMSLLEDSTADNPGFVENCEKSNFLFTFEGKHLSKNIELQILIIFLS